MDNPSAQASEYTALGCIGAVVGIKGWVRLISFTDPPDNILNFSKFSLSAPGLAGSQAAAEVLEQIEIDESRAQGKHFIAHIRGCDDRELARRYTGRELLVPQSILPDLEEGYYWFQLAGLAVTNLQDEKLGEVDHLIETGANDVLVIRATHDSIDDQKRLIPYIKEQVVKEVDLARKTLQVDWEKDY